MDIEDTEACYRAVKSRDRRFDGVFYTAVTHDRHLLPAVAARRAPRRTRNVTFHPTAAAAQARRLPRLQALPARRDARQPRTGTSPPTSPAGRCG